MTHMLDTVRLLVIITCRAGLSVYFWHLQDIISWRCPKIHRKYSSGRDNDQKPHYIQRGTNGLIVQLKNRDADNKSKDTNKRFFVSLLFFYTPLISNFHVEFTSVYYWTNNKSEHAEDEHVLHKWRLVYGAQIIMLIRNNKLSNDLVKAALLMNKAHRMWHKIRQMVTAQGEADWRSSNINSNSAWMHSRSRQRNCAGFHTSWRGLGPHVLYKQRWRKAAYKKKQVS